LFEEKLSESFANANDTTLDVNEAVVVVPTLSSRFTQEEDRPLSFKDTQVVLAENAGMKKLLKKMDDLQVRNHKL
jgi:hypothetical protein